MKTAGVLGIALTGMLLSVGGAEAGRSLMPLRLGMYADSLAACDPEGDYSKYNAQLAFWGDKLNNSVMARLIRRVRHVAESYELHLDTVQSDGLGGGGAPQSVIWNVVILDADDSSSRARITGPIGPASTGGAGRCRTRRTVRPARRPGPRRRRRQASQLDSRL